MMKDDQIFIEYTQLAGVLMNIVLQQIKHFLSLWFCLLLAIGMTVV